MLKKKKCYTMLYGCCFLVFVALRGAMPCGSLFFFSKETAEGQSLAKESTIYLVQLIVGQRNLILNEHFQ